MRKVQAFQTSDGALHVEYDAAVKHASRRYNDAMTALRVALQAKPYGLTIREALKAVEFIEANSDRIKEAAALRADWQILDAGEEDEEA